jgi:DNA (cytosine-5)-methyltransferase 1
MAAYYNEIDPYAAEWLRRLIKAGHIAPGIVDERDIREVTPDELREFTQCHFFAGIGVWSLALRRAGWPDDRPVWTGSCPCQPFSAAGGKAGFTDERHLWPHWYHLITQCRPDTVFGEQVASKDGLAWLDLVQTDLEGADYANAAIDLCAAGVGAPHIRQRLWFVAEGLADTDGRGPQKGWPESIKPSRDEGYADVRPEIAELRMHGRVADSSSRSTWGTEHGLFTKNRSAVREESSGAQPTFARELRWPGPTNGLWGAVDWLFCRDGKWRPVEPGTFPLANGAPGRVGRLRAYGNAINAEAAAQFIGAYIDL